MRVDDWLALMYIICLLLIVLADVILSFWNKIVLQLVLGARVHLYNFVSASVIVFDGIIIIFNVLLEI